MSLDDLIDRGNEVCRLLRDLKQEKELIEKKLVEAGAKPGQVLKSKAGRRIRMCQRRELQADLLEEVVSERVWEQITIRKPYAALIEAAIKRKLVRKDVVDSCYFPSRVWIEQR